MRPYVAHGGEEKDHPPHPAAPHQPDHAASDPDPPQGVGLVVSKKLWPHHIPGTCKCCLFGKRDFADIITVRILR